MLKIKLKSIVMLVVNSIVVNLVLMFYILLVLVILIIGNVDMGLDIVLDVSII